MSIFQIIFTALVVTTIAYFAALFCVSSFAPGSFAHLEKLAIRVLVYLVGATVISLGVLIVASAR